MDDILLPAFLSFVAGACGYIIVRFWLLPIRQYRKAKQRVQQALNASRNHHRTNRGSSKAVKPPDRVGQALRQGAADLVRIHDDELPYWYRLVLIRRGEKPLSATEPLMRLANISDPGHARKTAKSIERFLLLK